jgi:hypothetical protein
VTLITNYKEIIKEYTHKVKNRTLKKRRLLLIELSKSYSSDYS